MNRDDLQAALDRARAELKNLKLGDAAAGRHLEQLIAEIEGHLLDEQNAQHRKTLLARISDTIRRFEVQHPAFTAYLGEIAAALG